MINLANKNNIKNVSNKKLSKRKLHFKKWIWLILAIICFGFVVYSFIKIFSWNLDNKAIEAQTDEIEEITKVEEVPPSEEDVVVNPPEDTHTGPYWEYINLPLISVDFNELIQKNSDTVAFLRVNNTNINYPVVQTSDNDFYLTHAYDKSSNDAGWVFMDYRNNLTDLDDNTIIYAHSRLDKSMFGTLKNIFKNDWYNNTDNRVVYLSTPTENTLWQVFSVYTIPTETYYLTSNFKSEEEFQKFIDTMLDRSRYNFNADVNTKDKILTLSTCYDDYNKTVLHAKLIKSQKR